jgi:hypothetical protein
VAEKKTSEKEETSENSRDREAETLTQETEKEAEFTSNSGERQMAVLNPIHPVHSRSNSHT